MRGPRPSGCASGRALTERDAATSEAGASASLARLCRRAPCPGGEGPRHWLHFARFHYVPFLSLRKHVPTLWPSFVKWLLSALQHSP